jgi:hypothetical protein
METTCYHCKGKGRLPAVSVAYNLPDKQCHICKGTGLLPELPIKIDVGSIVEKIGGDYDFQGQVVSVFHKKDGKIRYVVEDDRRCLHLYSEKNLKLSGPRCGETHGTSTGTPANMSSSVPPLTEESGSNPDGFANRAECLESIESGLPFLYDADKGNAEAAKEINRRFEAMKELLPL